MSTADTTSTVRERVGQGRLPEGRAPTLGEAMREFVRWPTPNMLLSGMMIAWFVRLYGALWLGQPFSLGDVKVALVMVAAQPFVEWGIHVFLLHFRPRKVGASVVDPLASRKHRAHHEDPSNLEDTFIPTPVLYQAMAFHLIVWPLVLPMGMALTAIAVQFTIGVGYEWTHYLIHTNYRPQSGLYRRVWQRHRWHHYKNENYWFGVTMHLGDRVLQTLPKPGDVPVSPTARSLLGGEAKGASAAE